MPASRILWWATGNHQQVLSPHATAMIQGRCTFFDLCSSWAAKRICSNSREFNGITYDSSAKKVYFCWRCYWPQGCLLRVSINTFDNLSIPYSLAQKASWGKNLILPRRPLIHTLPSQLILDASADLLPSAWSRHHVSWIKFDENLLFHLTWSY